ncbi:radical SAM family heme chaperone HemW [Aquariibacter albus]|uniref:Heme chaperone HemW n=1 Tax=Aquariibacter albus TaxID=2759899 RepID=A0A839HNG0_9BURK|nr:radical SAM family heme chaperone HemW [Aquariibacter albus]MBB1160531.1 oxygen-independent coproporphyrinogen III oxidase-like protein [Aquariibacter albus]
MDPRPLTLHRDPGALRLPAPPTLAVYVHLPWCLKKCPYCDFNSHATPGGEALPEAAYLAALRADLEAALPLVWGRNVHSVFIGGGTPSLFSPAAIGTLVDMLRSLLRLAPGAEITLEANPGTFERDRFQGYADAGVTRLSVGVQSFDDAQLRTLGRVHDAAQARAALEEAARAFRTWNLDLMYALPGQTLEALDRELDQALAFAPPHLSVYHLTMEPNTVFGRRPPAGLPDDDLASALLDRLIERTAAAGLTRYEVSAFAREGHRCVHNQNYWQFGDYLGIGAGAHSKLSFAERVIRQVRWREPARYLAEAPAGRAVSNEHEIDPKDLPFEFMMNALRLKDGLPLNLFAERTGLPLGAILSTLDAAQQRGLLALKLGAEGWIQPTAKGFDFLNELVGMFLPD